MFRIVSFGSEIVQLYVFPEDVPKNSTVFEFSIGKEEWSLNVLEHESDNDFHVALERQPNKEISAGYLYISIKCQNSIWEIYHDSPTELFTQPFDQLVINLSQYKKALWAQYALMALEVPLEEIEEAA